MIQNAATYALFNAVLCLASDEAQYVTGVTLPVDAGLLTNDGPDEPRAGGHLDRVAARWWAGSASSA